MLIKTVHSVGVTCGVLRQLEQCILHDTIQGPI